MSRLGVVISREWLNMFSLSSLIIQNAVFP